MFRHLIFFILTVFFINSNAQNNRQQSKLDSILILRELSRNVESKLEDRLAYALRASQLSNQVNIDTTILRSDRNLSFLYLDADKYELFKETNLKNLKLATKLNDSIVIAHSNNNLGYYHYIKMKNDSSYYYYYNAESIYKLQNRIRNQVEVLSNMAKLQEEEKDYIGSEDNAIKALTLLLDLNIINDDKANIWSLYNLLGLTSLNLKDYQQAIEYNENALSIINDNSKGSFYYITSKNNTASIYTERRDYLQALSIYNKLLVDSDLKANDPASYAIVLGNIAYTKYLRGDKDIKIIDKKFREAYKISDSVQDFIGLMTISHDMSEFYLSINKKDSALILSKNAYKLARESSSNDIILKSLFTLSKIEGGEKGIKYLNEHIQLNDSLLQKERLFKNESARIKFNTNQIKAENKKISKQRLFFLFISIGLLISLTLIYIIISQRSKNKELRFTQQQQEANEEIYNLMLAQQDKIEEGRAVEKKRMSQELHDGILGRLFGTRLSLDSLNMANTDDAVKSREQYIEELKTIENEIRKISHDLNSDFVVGSSFIDIVETLIETQVKAYGLNYEFLNDESINWEAISNKNKIHIYRMLQETMQNIYKHAEASHINIGFTLKNNVILLSVEDDGIGFNVDKVRKGIGIKNINSRVKELEGKVDIDSVINEGTTIAVTIPV